MSENKVLHREKENKGIRMRSVSIVMTAMACVLAYLMLLTVNATVRGYRTLQADTNDYITYQQDAANLQAGSDYLTEQVRAFVVTGDKNRVADFNREVEETRRRDLALERFKVYLDGTETYQHLKEALRISNELEELEYYSIRLGVEGYGYDIREFPERVQQTELSAEDLALDARQQIEKAQTLVFDQAYQNHKSEISRNVTMCTETLIEESRQEQQTSSERLLYYIRLQEGLLALMVVSFFILVFQINRLMIRPLLKDIRNIRNQETLPMEGAYELQYLARTYNQIFEKTRQYQDELSYEASHDSLTGLYNRSLFEKVRLSVDQKSSAMILVDVDEFKGINDNYGHDVGDLALKKVSDLLLASFRSEDYVCRIGGDEFVVIMVHAGSELRDLVYGKIRRANEKLMNPEDGLPAFSISAGVAFGDRENPTDDIYKDADTVLYKIKKSGGNGCAFY